MNNEEYLDFINGFSGIRPEGIRLGQYAYNLLFEGYPEIANKITGTECDPFYNDKMLQKFLSKILECVKEY